MSEANNDARQPGWYPTPEDPARERFWDGTSWSTASRRSPDAPRPQQGAFTPSGVFAPDEHVVLQQWAPPTGEPVTVVARGGGWRRWAWLGALGVVVAALVIAGLVFQPFKKIEPRETATPSARPTATAVPSADPSGQPSVEPSVVPTATAAPTSAPVGVVTCSGGVVSPSEPGQVQRSNGLQMTLPPNWTFRFDRGQWDWLDDGRIWGRMDRSRGGQRFVGVALGGLSAQAGFTEPTQATHDILTCMTGMSGAFAGYTVQSSSEAMSVVNGATQTSLRALLAPPALSATEPPYEVLITTSQTAPGTPMVSVTSFCPGGDSAMCREAQSVVDTVRPG